MPFDPARLPRHAMVADVVTKPVETPLLRAAKAHGCRIQTGLEMSDAQATMQLDFSDCCRRMERPEWPRARHLYKALP